MYEYGLFFICIMHLAYFTVSQAVVIGIWQLLFYVFGLEVSRMKKQESCGVLINSHLEIVEDLIRSIKYGSITIIVQDGKIVQIDKTEKHRIRN